MTASLFTFLAIDGTTLEINSDRIDYMRPYTFNLPTGVQVGTMINVDGVDLGVQNSLLGINSVLPSTLVPQTLPSGIIPVFPIVLGSSQTDPFRLIDRRYYELWTMFNSPDGMSSAVYLANVKVNPPWLGGSNAATGNYGWAVTSTDLPPRGYQPIAQQWELSYNPLLHSEILPLPQQRISTDLPSGRSGMMDTNYYNLVSLGIP